MAGGNAVLNVGNCMPKTKKGAETAPETMDSVAQCGEAVNEKLVAELLRPFDPADWLDDTQALIYGAVCDGMCEIEEERETACADLDVWTQEYNQRWNSIRNLEYSRYAERRTVYTAAAVVAFADRYTEHVPELETAYRHVCASVVVDMRERLTELLATHGMTLQDGRRIDDENNARQLRYYDPVMWAIMSDLAQDTDMTVPYARTRAEYDVLTLFSDSALIGAMQARTDHLFAALDAAYMEHGTSSDTLIALTQTVWGDVLSRKWTTGTDAISVDDIPLLVRPTRRFFAIPRPGDTLVQANQVHGALTGQSRKGARLLTRNGFVELDEGAKCKTIVTASDDWRPMLPEDVWPAQRLASMVDAARLKHGAANLFPLTVPVEVGCQWAFGSCGGGTKEARAERGEELRALLARLRTTVTIDFRALARRGRIDVARVSEELGVAPTLYDCVYDGPLINTDYWEWDTAQVNRNGQTGKVFRIFSWPADYLYSIATGYAQRIPDSLTDLIEPGRKRGYESPEMLAVKSYLLARIVEMYRNSKLRRVIALEGLYAWVGAVDSTERRHVRERCQRYLTSWTIPRTAYDPGRQYPLIRKWEPVQSGQAISGYKVQLVRGGLAQILGV